MLLMQNLTQDYVAWVLAEVGEVGVTSRRWTCAPTLGICQNPTDGFCEKLRERLLAEARCLLYVNAMGEVNVT